MSATFSTIATTPSNEFHWFDAAESCHISAGAIRLESNFFKYYAANFNKLGPKRLNATRYDGSPIAGQTSLFPEHFEGNGKRPRPRPSASSSTT